MNSYYPKRRLGEFIILEYGKALDRKERDKNGKYPVYGANGIMARANKYFCDKKTIIIGRKGSAGEINITENKFWPLDVTYFIKYNEQIINRHYLYLLLKSLDLTRFAKGVKPGINRNDIYNLEVFIPNINKQNQIVEKVENLFGYINKISDYAKKNFENTIELYRSYLISIFLKKRDNSKKTKLKDVCSIRGGGTPSKSNKLYWKGTIPWVSSKDMKTKNISDTIDHISQKAIENSSTILIPEESILIVVRSGILAHTIPLGIARRKVAINQDIKALIPIKSINADFLYYHLSALQNELLNIASKGATVHRIPSELLENTELNIPTHEEQIMTAKKLNALSNETKRLEAIYQKKIEDLEELKKSILQRAFSGQL